MTTTPNGVSLMATTIGGVMGAAKSLFKSQLDRIKRFVNEAARPGGEAFA